MDSLLVALVMAAIILPLVFFSTRAGTAGHNVGPISQKVPGVSAIFNLPQVSDAFVSHIHDRVPAYGEWTPCPRCGEKTVTTPSRAAFVLAPIGAFGAVFFTAWMMLALLRFPLIWEWLTGDSFLIFWAAILLLGLLVGAVYAVNYTCKSCSFTWTRKDIEVWQLNRVK